jgi:type III secretion system HrpE/YscL family protein
MMSTASFLLCREGWTVQAAGSVLAPAELGALADAEELLTQAQQRAAAIVEQARGAAEQIEAEARNAGAQAAQAELATRLAELDLSAARAVDLARGAIERICIRATADLVRGIEPEQWFVAVLARVESCLRDESFVELRVAPGDAAVATQACARLAAQGGAPYAIRVQPDPALDAHAAVLRTSNGVVETGLELHLEALREATCRAVARLPLTPEMTQ